MNLYVPGIYCNGTERMIDSLASGFNNTAYRCNSGNVVTSTCTEISTRFIFNNTYMVKAFSSSGSGPYYHATYASGIGILNYFQAYSMQTCTDTLRGCVINGVLYGDTSTLVGINQISTEIPENFSLLQNYPNPFNPVTKIKFDISGATVAQTFLSVYDILGHEVAVLVNQQLQPGSYEADWDASAYPSGVYYYKLEVIDPSTPLRVTETKKMVLIK